MPAKNAKPKATPEPDVDEDETDVAEPTDTPIVDASLVEINFAGAKFVIPRDRGDWSTEALAWLSEGKFNLFVKYLLERTLPGQWRALCVICPRTRDFSAFFVLASKVIKDECTGD